MINVIFREKNLRLQPVPISVKFISLWTTTDPQKCLQYFIAFGVKQYPYTTTNVEEIELKKNLNKRYYYLFIFLNLDLISVWLPRFVIFSIPANFLFFLLFFWFLLSFPVTDSNYILDVRLTRTYTFIVQHHNFQHKIYVKIDLSRTVFFMGQKG